ncbi:MAG: MGMT family protein [Bacteroidia bacterium]|nr:MGMT family protein [Bacteroidia bacterium]HQV01646.1 MGMT family protein [Bacteroidia bacterium]
MKKKSQPKKIPDVKPVNIGVDFYHQVHDVARLVPYGRVTSYGAIAKALAAPKAARLVGYAMHLAHTASKPVPAHRVVNSQGLLTGKHHFGSPFLMQQLLEAEGVEVVNNKVSNFKNLFWNPLTEL